MKVSNIELSLCAICPNRHLCIPESELALLGIMGEQFSHRDFLYFKKDDYIFKDGDNADGVFNIYQGYVKVYSTDENGKEILLENATDGESIGYNSIVDGHFINSAKTIENTFCCFLKISEVRQLIKKGQPITEKILIGY